MREILEFSISEPVEFKAKLLEWAGKQQPVMVLDSHSDQGYNQHTFSYHRYDCMVATGIVGSISKTTGQAFDQLKALVDETNDWLFGHFSYDLKNELEKLESNHPDHLNFPDIHFFQPQLVLLLKGAILQIQYLPSIMNEGEAMNVFEEISNTEIHPLSPDSNKIVFNERINNQEYLDKLNKIMAHIQRGDIYEMNFCQEFYAENVSIDPLETYRKLKHVSPTPFSAFYHFKDSYCLSASPERFMAKRGSTIISQPIKGTIRRGKSGDDDLHLIRKLQNDPKERAENIMIVDLVRNDLSRSAARGSVKIEELCGIYTFPQLHQMISTISAELNPKHHFLDALKYAFPMGSMTGAPKIRAMELIEEYESSKRGIYSGAIGYIDPKGDFDFNVVIRSLLYNAKLKYLSYFVGGAITHQSIPEKEYEECLLKAEAMVNALS
ncbi:MAG: anthranilate synthase component I family protein [Bacteroidales bacterium]|nr:anthranilate synthase component I family protein [Bacteroidales bacterium]MCF8459001.1 anthranilate synthase component I family protein [Bacteroidales bacterium]